MSVVSAVIHSECVGCLSTSQPLPDPGDETLVLLAMLRAGNEVDAIYRSLCFVHRRSVDEAAKAIAEKAGRGSPAQEFQAWAAAADPGEVEPAIVGGDRGSEDVRRARGGGRLEEGGVMSGTTRGDGVCVVCGRRGDTWGVVASIANIVIDARVCESALGEECQEIFFARVPIMLRRIAADPVVAQPDAEVFFDTQAIAPVVKGPLP